MRTLTIHPSSSSACVMRPRPLLVYVNGRRRRDLHVAGWSILPAPDFGRVTVTSAMSGKYRSDRRVENIAALPPVGDRLHICMADPRRHVVFDGYVTRHFAGVGPDAESLGLEAEDVLRIRLNTPLAGRWQVSDASVVFVPGGGSVFNVEPDGLASEADYAVNSRSCRLFQPAPDGRLWSVADILNYLLATCVPADVGASGLEELANLGGRIYPEKFSLTGLSAREAIVRAAAPAGLAVRSSVNWVNGEPCTNLVFYRPGRTGRRRSIRLQRPGETIDGRRSNLWKGKIAISRRPSRRTIRILGGLKRYESTFLLNPGWDTDAESYHYRDFVRTEAPDWPDVADVFRKWVLNESGRYCEEPYNLEKFDFTAISNEDFVLTAARWFQPCLSVDSAGESLGVVIEISCNNGSTWRRYGGPIRISTDECAVYLADDALPADYFQAALGHVAKVRVTATVASDRNLSAEKAGDLSCPAEVVQIPTAEWAKVHEGSIFYQNEDRPPPAERDDTARLVQLTKSLSESRALAVEAEVTLGWLDATCNVGDIAEQIDGRRLGLASFPGAAPHVQAIEHRCGQEWTTHLTVSG